MKEEKVDVVSCERDDGFVLEIMVREKTIEAWVYHRDYGVKSLMFGVRRKKNNWLAQYIRFKMMALNNFETYAQQYANDYMGD